MKKGEEGEGEISWLSYKIGWLESKENHYKHNEVISLVVQIDHK